MKIKPVIVFVLALIVLAIFCFWKNGKFEKLEIPGIVDAVTKYCTDNGGTIKTMQRGDGKEYKICFFEDNRQCEAESLLKGDCPIGGLKITGYITEAAVYCAILGGKYEIGETGEDGIETGNCSFFNGNVCNVWDLYNGKCEKGEINPIVYQNDEFNFSLNLPSDWKDKYQVTRTDGENGIRYISFNYGEAIFFKIAVVPYSFWENQENKSGDYVGRNNSDVFIFEYSSDPARSDKQWGEEYLKMAERAEDIRNTFKITKPYVFLEKSEENGDDYTIEVKYPYIGSVKNGQVNIEINDFVEKIKSSFKNEISDIYPWDGKNTLDIYYDTYEINEDFVSIRFEIYEYTGGAHPMTTSQSFNYDLKNGKFITLADIFDTNKDYIKSISDKTIQYLIKVNTENNFSDDDSIREGAGAKAENYQIFTFNKNTIVFYFNAYQVAPYAAGRQDVIFPFSSLKGILRSDAVSNYSLVD